MDGRWDRATKVSRLTVGSILAAGLVLALLQVNSNLPDGFFVPIVLALLVGSCVLLVCLVRAVAVSPVSRWRRGGSLLVAVLLLPVILLATTWLVLWWGTTFAGWAFGFNNAVGPLPSIPPAIVHAADCEDVPPSVIDRIEASVLVGHTETITREEVSSYRIRLDKAEFSGWVALPATVGLLDGYLLAAQVDGAHSWRRLPNGGWQNLNTFSNWVLFFRPGELASTKPVTTYRDKANSYRTKLTSLGNWDIRTIDRDSWATVVVCLGYQGNASLLENEMSHPWIWNGSWFDISSDTYGRPYPAIWAATARQLSAHMCRYARFRSRVLRGGLGCGV